MTPGPPTPDEIEFDIANDRYVIRRRDGLFTCGFQHMLVETVELARRLGEEIPELVLGSKEVPILNYQLQDLVINERLNLGTWFNVGTPKEVQRSLERLRVSSKQSRLWLGDPETGVIWWTDNGVAGYVDRNVGALQKPLMQDLGGQNYRIVPDKVLAIAFWDRPVQQVQNPATDPPLEFLYRHEKFVMPEMKIRRLDFGFSVEVGDKELAAFGTSISAITWQLFQEGKVPYFKAADRLR